MYGAHPTSKSPYYYEQPTTITFSFLHIYIVILQKSLFYCQKNKINAGSNWSLVVRLTDSSVQQICVYIILYAFINSQNQMPHLWGRFCGLIGEKSPHNSPSQPWRGQVGPNIDRCIMTMILMLTYLHLVNLNVFLVNNFIFLL